MRRTILSLFGITCAAAAFVWLAAAPAVAQDLDALRTSGAVAECASGYLKALSGSAAGAVKSINAQRKQVYQKRAASQGVSAAEVGRIYAQEIRKKAPAGTKFDNGC
jgi:uncharacterized protein YdbL (DUF1318 family)